MRWVVSLLLGDHVRGVLRLLFVFPTFWRLVSMSGVPYFVFWFFKSRQ